MSLFEALNNKVFDCENDDFLMEKRSLIFVSDRVSEPITLRFIDLS